METLSGGKVRLGCLAWRSASRHDVGISCRVCRCAAYAPRLPCWRVQPKPAGPTVPGSSPSSRPSPPPATDPVVGQQVLQRLLKNNHCFVGGGGQWWNFEFCYNKHVKQFHKNADGSKIENLLGTIQMASDGSPHAPPWGCGNSQNGLPFAEYRPNPLALTHSRRRRSPRRVGGRLPPS